MSKQLMPDEQPTARFVRSSRKHNVKKHDLERTEHDGVAYLRAMIGGTLQGLARRNDWDTSKVAAAMGASQRHAEQLLSDDLMGIPLEVLVDMATFAGVQLELSVMLPSSEARQHNG